MEQPQQEYSYEPYTDNPQQQQRGQVDSMYADAIREEKVTNIIAQIDPDKLLVDIEHRIRGEKKDQYTKNWIPISETNKNISEELISDFMSYLGCILNQGTSMSNYSIQQINNLMEKVIDWVGDNLDVNSERYNIDGNYTEMTRIGDIICMSCFSVFLRALNGMEARRIFSALKITESIVPEKKGILDSLKFWG